MKAILIDVKNQTVREVDHAGGIHDIYRKLECDTFTVPVQLDNGDALYIDDESLLKPAESVPGAFLFEPYPFQPLFGHGLIIGTNMEGESQDAKSKPGEIRRMVTFLKAEQVAQQHAEIAARPIQIYFDK